MTGIGTTSAADVGGALKPNDVVALAAAVEKIRLNPKLVQGKDVALFRKLLLSWGCKLPSSDASEKAPQGSSSARTLGSDDEGKGGKKRTAEAQTGSASTGAGDTKASAAGASGVLELESEDEDAPPQREMELPAGQLEDEMAGEPGVDMSRRSKARDEDPELLPMDAPPYPAMPPHGCAEASDARKKVLAKVDRKASEALAKGDVGKALDRYTESIRTGGVTSMMLATRAALLLKQRRPCAAIRDCCAALSFNPECGKAFHVRGVAHRKLGHWKRAHRDLSHGQRLDFSEDSVNVHMHVAIKAGMLQEESATQPVFRVGQVVRLHSIQKVPQLNGRVGILLRPSPNDEGRWDVEVELGQGPEVKSIKSDSMEEVGLAQAVAWRKERKTRLDSEDIAAMERATEQLRTSPALLQGSDLAFLQDLLQGWGCDLEALAEDAEIIQRTHSVTQLNSDDEETKKKRAQKGDGGGGAAAPAAAAPAEAPAVMELESDEEIISDQREMVLPPHMLTEELAEEPCADKQGDKQGGGKAEDDDPERLPKDPGPYPLLPPYGNTEPSDARKKVLAKVKEQAAEAIAQGDVAKAMDRYTEAIREGGATGLMLASRGTLLLKQRRPCAAIRDCCAALTLNPDCGKAYHVRGVAHRKLGHWKRAHRDLSQGQRLDFSEDSVSVAMFVAKKVGAFTDQKTGSFYQTAGSAGRVGAKKAVELLFDNEKPERRKPRRVPTMDLRIGQAVRVGGLLKAPHLNNKRGIVQQLNDKDVDRWDIELRLERGRVEVKSIRSENIMIIRAAESKQWREEENLHAEERKQREKAEKRWLEDEERRKRMAEKERSLRGGAFEGMDASERLEAEMSGMPLDDEAMSLLRRLRAEEALDILHQAGITSVGGNLSHFVRIKVKKRLGEPDSDEEPEEKRRRAEQAAEGKKAAAKVAANVEARLAAEAKKNTDSSTKEEGFDPEGSPSGGGDESSEDEDFDRLEEESAPAPDQGFLEDEVSIAHAAVLEKLKKEAVEALESGDVESALQRYSAVIAGGGASALMLAKRGELLLKQRRPLAAISDCSAALELNGDLGKAYRVRGIANRKLGRWQEGHRDLKEGQRLDYDEGTAAVQKFVAEKVRVAEEKAARSSGKRRKGGAGGGPSGKRSRN